jgi:hypothetical protein
LKEATTLIAEMGAASTTHVVAALCPFYPYLALWALFELRALHKLLKGLVEKVRVSVSLKFFTGLFLVSIRFTIQTIFFLAFDALEIFTIFAFVENKSVVAVRSWTPRNILLLR